MPPIEQDERALQFDLRLLEPGDAVEVWVEASREWRHARVARGPTGLSCIVLGDGRLVRFESALLMGLRRILN
jgi:hypothetical protein